VFEQSYEDYRVFANGETVPPLPPPDTARFRVVERDCPEDAETCPERHVLIPRDTASVVASEALPGDIFDDVRLASDAQVRQLEDLLTASGWRGMLYRRPRLHWQPLDASLI